MMHYTNGEMNFNNKHSTINNYNNTVRMTPGISFKAGYSRLNRSTLEKVRVINMQREEKQLATATATKNRKQKMN